MIGEIRILTTACTDPVRNLAAEEVLMKEVPEGTLILFLWQNDNTIVIGKNQNAWQECSVDAFLQAGGRIVRRSSGGGAVYHDTGNQNFSFLVRKKDYDVRRQLEVIRRAVSSFGIPAEISGRNDLSAMGRKFSGNAFLDDGHVCCHHGTVLIRTDTAKMKTYLTPAEQKLKAKGVASVESRVMNLAEICPGLTPEALREALADSVGSVYGPARIIRSEAEPDPLLLKEAEEKYASEEWTLGRQSAFDIRLQLRGAEALITLDLQVKEGIIRRAEVWTDAMDPGYAEGLPEALAGKRYTKEEVIRTTEDYLHEKMSGEDISVLNS